ncbi:MAG: CRTAC1 family protein, partial [Planctomycetota bacterium]
TNYEEESNRLYRGLEGELFEDATDLLGVGAGSIPLVGWGAGFEDFDSDGDRDLVVANGHIFDNISSWQAGGKYLQPCLFYRCDRGPRTRFVSVGSKLPALNVPRAHRGLATADYDCDGDVDLAVLSLDGPLVLLENTTPQGSYLAIGISGLGPGGRDAVGTRVDVTTASGVHTRWIIGGGSYLSASSPELHFGLGPDPVQAIRVTWPNGDVASVPPPELSPRLLIELSKYRGGDDPLKK